MSAAVKFKPKIIGFVCHWWGYGAADLAGVSRIQYSHEIRLIRVMCSGRIDLSFVIKSFLNGADGVYIAACKLNECNYTTNGNYHALNMVLLFKRILEYFSINPDRINIEFMSAADGNKFVDTVQNFTNHIREIGQLGISEGIDSKKLKETFNQLLKLVPYIKIAKREKLGTPLLDAAKREDFFTINEIDEMFKTIPSYYIVPDKCRACGICAKRCPADAISGGKNLIHIINQENCIKCGTCFEACPFESISKLIGKEAPAPIAEEDRIIKKKK